MSDKPKLDITSPDAPVPAFTCLVYISSDGGQVTARVANLGGIEATGSSERDVLGKIVPAFKERVAELISGGEEIPWIDPPEPPRAGEQKRIVPAHL
jgi:hypothetical protein